MFFSLGSVWWVWWVVGWKSRWWYFSGWINGWGGGKCFGVIRVYGFDIGKWVFDIVIVWLRVCSGYIVVVILGGLELMRGSW